MLLFVFLAWLTAAPPAATPSAAASPAAVSPAPSTSTTGTFGTSTAGTPGTSTPGTSTTSTPGTSSTPSTSRHLPSVGSPPSSPPDLHVVVGSEFVYMARTRPLRQDWWLGEKRRAVTADGRLTITREDLGVVWRIDTKAGTYTETPRPAPGAAPDGPAPFDIHTAGYTWEPEFDWVVRETGREATIAGRPCREFGANGQADYSDTTVTFWGCAPLPPGLPSPTEVVTAQLRNTSTVRMIREWAGKQGLWVLQVEETTEPAIAPTLLMRVKVEALESAPAPPGTFELSPSLKKAGEVTR